MIKKILNYTFFLICLFTILIYDVNADTYTSSQFSAQLYDNYGPTLISLTTEQSNGRWSGIIPSMTANSSGGAWGISSPVALLTNHTYTMTITINGTYGGNITQSTYNRIGVGSTLSEAVSSYQNNSNVVENYSKVLNDGMSLQFAFTPSVNASYIVFPFATSASGDYWQFYIYDIVIDDLGSTGITEVEINNSLNNQTSVINNSISNTEENIKNELNNVEDSINNTIKDNFNSCEISDNLLDYSNPTSLDTNRFTYTYISEYYQFRLNSSVTNSGGNFPIGFQVNLEPNTTYTLSWYDTKLNSNIRTYFYIYDTNWSSNLIAYSELNDYSLTFTTNSNTNYFIQYYITGSYKTGDVINLSSLMLNTGTTAKAFEPFGEICQNKIDSTNDKLDQTNQQLGDLNNNLNDSDTTGATNEAENFFSGFQTDTFGLTSIITAPLNLIGSITSSSCSPLGLQVPFVKNTTLNLPCMTTIYENYFGSFLSVYQTITFGIVAYWVCVRIFALVKDFKNPDHDEIEVLDL